MEGSTATEWPMSQVLTNRIFQPCSNSPLPTEGKRRFELPSSDSPVAAGLPRPAFEEQSKPGPAFCRSARSLPLRPRWPTHALLALRGSEGERVMRQVSLCPDQAEAEAAVAVAGREVVAIRRPNGPREVKPAAAPNHPGRA